MSKTEDQVSGFVIALPPSFFAMPAACFSKPDL